MRRFERVLFIHPPQTDYFLPPLGPACLIAYLKHHRPDVSYQFLDLNVDYVHWLVQAEQIQTACATGMVAFDQLRRRDRLGPDDLHEMQAYLTALVKADEVLHMPRPLMEALCDVDIVRNSQAYGRVKAALGHVIHLHSLALRQRVDKPEKMLWVEHGVATWDSEILLETLARPEVDPYTAFWQAHPDLTYEIMQCDALCLSLLYYEQTLGAFSVAAFAKRLRPDLPILMGGSWITAIRHCLPHVPELFAYADAIIPAAGEVSLLEAIQRLDRGDPLTGSPNAMTVQDHKVVMHEVANFPRIEALPAPDFDTYNLQRYLLPAPVLPFQITRGCYWGQCTFCTHHLAQGLGYSMAKTNSIGDKLAYLADRYQTNLFYFVDEAIPPAKLRDIPAALREHQLDIRWMSECRLERSLTRQAFDQLAESGCHLLLFGLETGSQRIMDLMKKGVQMPDAQRCLRDCAEAGIYTTLFLMFGFPTETLDDLLDTFRFVQANQPWIDTIGTSIFTLTAESPISLDPAAFGVTLEAETFRGAPLKEDLAYRVAYGFSREDAEAMCKWMEQTETFQRIWRNCPWLRRSHALFIAPKYARAGDQDTDVLDQEIDRLRQMFRGIAQGADPSEALERPAGKIRLQFSAVTPVLRQPHETVEPVRLRLLQ